MEGIIVRRVLPSDNSCLFNAVGYVMDHDKNKAPALRQVIAAAVASDPIKYSEAFLEKPNEEYCAWILNPEKWGGAIELSIFSEYYGREIAVYDIQTTRCDLYGEGQNYSERVMLTYDGFHYDALAVSPFDGAPEEFDQTIFDIDSDRSIGPAERLALNLVMEQQSSFPQYTKRVQRMEEKRERSQIQEFPCPNQKPKEIYIETANFPMHCGVCQIEIVGRKEAIEHAQETGHAVFQKHK